MKDVISHLPGAFVATVLGIQTVAYANAQNGTTPLAFEVAAERVEALGVTQLLDRIDDRFALLAGGDRLAPQRQRSLAAMVENDRAATAHNAAEYATGAVSIEVSL